MLKSFRSFFLSLLLLTTASGVSAQPAFERFVKLQQNMQDVQAMQYNLKLEERIHGKIRDFDSSFIKLSVKPFKLYYRQLHPNDGLEMLYNAGEYGENNMLVNPNGFPWVTLTLDPYGKLARKKRHYSIFESGFGFFCNVNEKIIQQYKDGQGISVSLGEDEIISACGECYRLIIEKNDFSFVDYKVKENETLDDIAWENGVSSYLIMERNPDVGWYDDVEPGDVIKIPNAFAKKIRLTVCKKTNLPVVIEIYDDKGLFERLTYSNMTVDPPFKEDAFSDTNEDYHF